MIMIACTVRTRTKWSLDSTPMQTIFSKPVIVTLTTRRIYS